MILPFIVLGLAAGAVYGLAGVGLVLTYKTSRVFNFGHGALGAISAYVFYTLHVQHNVSWPVAAVVAVLVVGPVAGILLERLGKALAGQSLAMTVASTVGILLVVEGATTLVYGTTPRDVPSFLGGGGFVVAGASVTWSQLYTFLFALVATAGLYVFFRVTRAGAAMRAVVDSPELLELEGISASAVRRTAWIIGVCFAGASGVLFASQLPSLDPFTLTLLVVQAFGAAAIGGFTNLPVTFAGGLTIGVLASLSTKYFQSGIWAGLSSSLPFIVLFLVLLVFPKRYLADRAIATPLRRAPWRAPAPVQIAGLAAVVLFLGLVPSFAGVHLTAWTIGVANIVLFLSLGLLMRTAGQVSLCQATFAAIGAAGFSHLTVDAHLPWGAALVVMFLIMAPIGALLAIPAIRLTPLYLALATFGFGILVQYMFFSQGYLFGASNSGLTEPAPHWAGLDTGNGYYYLVLVLAALVAGVVVLLNRTRLGRLLRVMADSPIVVETGGGSTMVSWVLVFALSAGLAAVAGVLAAVPQQVVSSTGYSPLNSLLYIAVLVVVVGGAPWYAVLAGLGLALPSSYWTSPDVANWLTLLSGIGVLLYATVPPLLQGKARMPRVARPRQPDGAGRLVSDPAPHAGGRLPVAALGPEAPRGVVQGALELTALTVRFGGVTAVDGVSLTAPAGRITGLIGPNGAGKTSTFNACSGLVPPSGGRILLGGRDLTHASPSARGRRGLGRTFQQVKLCDSLTVWENVAVGAESGHAGSNPLRHLLPRPGERAAVRESAAQALDLCGLADLAGVPVAALSSGHRRMVELARCLAGRSELLLLDEPAAGLDREETLRFGQVLSRVVDARGTGILLVEHDVSFVMDVCDHIYVLDFGQLVFQGSPGEVLGSPVVQAAYLGSDLPAPQAGEARTTI